MIQAAEAYRRRELEDGEVLFLRLQESLREEFGGEAILGEDVVVIKK